MGLGPPICDYCNVWMRLYPPRVKEQEWLCPVCETDGGPGLKYTRTEKRPPPLDDSNIPFLRFLKGKPPTE